MASRVIASEVKRILESPRAGKGSYNWAEWLGWGAVDLIDGTDFTSKRSSVYASAQQYANKRGKMVVRSASIDVNGQKVYRLIFGDITPEYKAMIAARKNAPKVSAPAVEPPKPMNARERKAAKKAARLAASVG